MTNFTESNSFDANVYELATTDPVQGGPGGVSNTPLQSLVNRSRWLYNQITSLLTSVATLAPLNSPALTGSPTAPTAAAGDGSTAVATTAFVRNLQAGVASVSVAGSSNVTLTAAQYGCGIVILTGALTGNINVIFPTSGEWIVYNNSSGAFTITAKTAGGTGVTIVQGKIKSIWTDATNILSNRTDFDSIAMTGAPSAPTQTASDNSTKVATTAYADRAATAVATTFASSADVAAGTSGSEAVSPAALAGAGMVAQTVYGATQTPVVTTSTTMQSAISAPSITKRKSTNKVIWIATLQYANDQSSSGAGAILAGRLAWDSGGAVTAVATGSGGAEFGGTSNKDFGSVTIMFIDPGSLPQTYTMHAQFCSADGAQVSMNSCSVFGIEQWS